MSEERGSPRVTVAIPLFNEEESVDRLLDSVWAVLRAIPGSNHEVVCVDDGSTDATLDLLKRACQRYPGLRVVALSRNFGHQAAVSAAMDHARGDVVLVMDGDLQDDPGVLPRFLDEFASGADVVYAVRSNRPDGLLRRSGYWLHYRLMSFISDSPVQVDAGDFALVSRRVVDLMSAMPERQRYMRGLRSWVGLRQVGIPVDRHERHAGESKYTLRSLAALAFEGVFAFSRMPLRIATILGGATVLAGLAYGIFVVVNRIVGGPPQGFATLALLQVGFSGMLLLVLGVIGEYVGRIYEEVKRRPLYLVDRVFETGEGDGRVTGSEIPRP